jgi:preprotein translocase subunit SecG
VHLASQIASAAQVLLGIGLIVLVLMHSGKDAGLSGLGVGGGSSSYAGTAVMERNLTRLTIVVAVVFGVNGLVVGYLLNH